MVRPSTAARVACCLILLCASVTLSAQTNTGDARSVVETARERALRPIGEPEPPLPTAVPAPQPAPRAVPEPAAARDVDAAPANGRAPADPTIVAATAEARAAGHELTGDASWYGMRFQGRLTANGETFDTNELTAAHRTLPFDTIVRVANLDNGRTVVVRINDRGPFVDGRVIDLSRAAADILDMTGVGVAAVRLDIMHYQEPSDLRTLQVGSFGRRDSAVGEVERLLDAGFRAAIETVATLGVHRVIIQGVREAEIPDHRARLAELGFQSVLVRRK